MGSLFQAAYSLLQMSAEDQAEHGTQDVKYSMLHQQYSYIKSEVA